MEKPVIKEFMLPEGKPRAPRIALLSRAMFPYHSRVMSGFLRKVEACPDLNWRPIVFFCKEPRVDVMHEQMQEIRNDEYDLVISIGALYSSVVAEHVREKKLTTPFVFSGVTDPFRIGILPKDGSQEGITGVVREQVPYTWLADFLVIIRRNIKRVLIPYYQNSELGHLEERLRMLADTFATYDVQVVLMPVGTVDDVVPSVLRHMGVIDTVIIPEGSFVADLTVAISKLCKQYHVMLVVHTMEQSAASIAVTFTQDIAQLGEALFDIAGKILTDGKKPSEIPILTLPNDRKIIVDVEACVEQGVDLDPIALFCLNESIVI